MNQTLIAIACILAGTAILWMDKSEAMAGMLFAAGAGVIGRQAHVAKVDAKRSAEKAQEALDATQTLRSDWNKSKP